VKLYTLRETADVLRITPQQLTEHVRDGQLAYINVGQGTKRPRMRFAENDLLIGPSAVGARVIETALGRYYHPIWTMTASVALTAAGGLLLLGYFPAASLAIVLYAAGNGIGSIARGTLPLALFGAARYPVLMGRLALPLLIAMSIAPYVGARALQTAGPGSATAIIAGLALTNVVLIAALWRTTERLRAR
jgi:hypothetical protein